MRPYRLHDTYNLFPNIAFLFSDELKLFVTSQSHQKEMHNLESIYKKFFQLSVSTRNGLTSDYKRVYEAEICYSILLTTTGIQPTVLVEYPPQTTSSPLPQVEKVAEHTSNSLLA